MTLGKENKSSQKVDADDDPDEWCEYCLNSSELALTVRQGQKDQRHRVRRFVEPRDLNLFKLTVNSGANEVERLLL